MWRNVRTAFFRGFSEGVWWSESLLNTVYSEDWRIEKCFAPKTLTFCRPCIQHQAFETRFMETVAPWPRVVGKNEGYRLSIDGIWTRSRGINSKGLGDFRILFPILWNQILFVFVVFKVFILQTNGISTIYTSVSKKGRLSIARLDSRKVN